MTTASEIRVILVIWGANEAQIAAIPRTRTTLDLLRGVDTEAREVYRNAGAWLRRRNSSTVFGGRTPLSLLAVEGERGAEVVLRHLRQMGLGARLAEKRQI